VIDGHVHIERGPYDIEWIKQFVCKASERGIYTLHLLEHSHRFFEFSELYQDVVKCNDYQRNWLSNKMQTSLEDYKNLIKQVREYQWPINLKFGLEICYIEGKEKLIEEISDSFSWDFLTGSVHWIDGWGFDHKSEFWQGRDSEELFQRYYSIMMSLVKSNLFDILAHPDSIKCFGHSCDTDMKDIYRELSQSLKHSNMQVEQSAGLFLNYKHKEMGMNKQLLSTLKEYDVNIITASDAHRPEDTGAYITEMQQLILDQP
jgi:histidinol-phosphatase (PHP family)